MKKNLSSAPVHRWHNCPLELFPFKHELSALVVNLRPDLQIIRYCNARSTIYFDADAHRMANKTPFGEFMNFAALSRSVVKLSILRVDDSISSSTTFDQHAHQTRVTQFLMAEKENVATVTAQLAVVSRP